MKYAAKSDGSFIAAKERLSNLFKILFLHTAYTFLTQYLWYRRGISNAYQPREMYIPVLHSIHEVAMLYPFRDL